MEFGDRLKELLSDRQLSQKDFATALNIAPSTIGNYIRQLREPDYGTLKRIASYFQVSTDFLLGINLDIAQDNSESELLQIYRVLDPKQKLLLMQQAKLLMRQNWDYRSL